jgi:hypothetical protein
MKILKMDLYTKRATTGLATTYLDTISREE